MKFPLLIASILIFSKLSGQSIKKEDSLDIKFAKDVAIEIENKISRNQFYKINKTLSKDSVKITCFVYKNNLEVKKILAVKKIADNVLLENICYFVRGNPLKLIQFKKKFQKPIDTIEVYFLTNSKIFLIKNSISSSSLTNDDAWMKLANKFLDVCRQ